VWVDIAWWTCTWAEAELKALLDDHRARVGYSTAFWRSIRFGRPLYERTAWHVQLQARAGAPYPPALARAIIELNRPWLDGHPFSFRHQLASAIGRGDVVSRNHRVAAWIASYFDIIFAANRVLHPGEKKLVDIAERECGRLPLDMRVDVEDLVRTLDPLDSIDRMQPKLDEFLSSIT